jgi:predicted nucleotidyltransferase component of viral defense system
MGASGNKDNIMIEVNYSLRSHVLEAEERPIITKHFTSEYQVKSLAPLEIYESKMNALLSRAAARDLYDARNMIHYGLFDTKGIDSITKRKIKTDLNPVIKTKDDFELESAKKLVKEYISDLKLLTKKEKDFLNKFEDEKIIERIRNHPMVLWKIR